MVTSPDQLGTIPGTTLSDDTIFAEPGEKGGVGERGHGGGYDLWDGMGRQPAVLRR